MVLTVCFPSERMSFEDLTFLHKHFLRECPVLRPCVTVTSRKELPGRPFRLLIRTSSKKSLDKAPPYSLAAPSGPNPGPNPVQEILCFLLSTFSLIGLRDWHAFTTTAFCSSLCSPGIILPPDVFDFSFQNNTSSYCRNVLT